MECFSMSTVYRFTSCHRKTTLGRMPGYETKTCHLLALRRTQNTSSGSSHLQAALEEINQRWKEDVLLSLAHFKHRKRMVALWIHVHGEQHGAVNPTSLCVGHPQVDAFAVCLHVVTELRLQQEQTSQFQVSCGPQRHVVT